MMVWIFASLLAVD